MNKPTSTNNPTRSSVHVNCFLCAIAIPPQRFRTRTLLCHKQKLLQIPVGGVQQFLCRPLEINFAVSQHHDVRGRSIWTRPVSAEARDMPGRLIETEIREAEGVL